MGECRRWKNVTFELNIPHLRYLDGVAGNLPCLESLCLTVVGDLGNIRVVDERFDAFQDAPRLRSISLEDLPRHIHLSFPLSQLTYFNVDSCDHIDHAHIIPRLSNVVHGIFSTRFTAFEKAPVCLRQLRTLSCEGRDISSPPIGAPSLIEANAL